MIRQPEVFEDLNDIQHDFQRFGWHGKATRSLRLFEGTVDSGRQLLAQP